MLSNPDTAGRIDRCWGRSCCTDGMTGRIGDDVLDAIRVMHRVVAGSSVMSSHTRDRGSVPTLAMRCAMRTFEAVRFADCPEQRARAFLWHSAAMRARLLLPGLFVLVLASCNQPAPPVELQRVERTGFSMDIPVWPVGNDEDARAVGRYTVQQGRRMVEASWTVSEASSVAELEQIGSSLQQAFGFTLHDQRDETVPGQIRLHLTFDVQGKGWAAMSMVQCVAPGVLVTLAVTDERREHTEHLRDRMLSTLVCPGDASQLAAVWPSTDLPQDFGAMSGEAIMLGHRDGRWLMVAAMAGSIVGKMRSSHQAATQLLASFGNMLGSRLTPKATASPGETLSGPASVWYVESDTLGDMVATAFACAEGQSGYLVFAGDDKGATSLPQLEALSLRFACPGATTRRSFRGEVTPLLERPSACDVGAETLCESNEASD
jgi:hypothetical protein